MKILVLYYSKSGNTQKLAHAIGMGIESTGITAVIRRIPEFDPNTPRFSSKLTDPLVTEKDLRECDGIAIGSPAYFGGMAAPMKHFWDTTVELWLSGSFINKPAAVFTSNGTQHGGHEAVLLALMLPLIHHGAIIVGIPYTNEHLKLANKGGSPYGAGHVEFKNPQISENEHKICQSLGKRLGEICLKLKE